MPHMSRTFQHHMLMASIIDRSQRHQCMHTQKSLQIPIPLHIIFRLRFSHSTAVLHIWGPKTKYRHGTLLHYFLWYLPWRGGLFGSSYNEQRLVGPQVAVYWQNCLCSHRPQFSGLCYKLHFEYTCSLIRSGIHVHFKVTFPTVIVGKPVQKCDMLTNHRTHSANVIL